MTSITINEALLHRYYDEVTLTSEMLRMFWCSFWSRIRFSSPLRWTCLLLSAQYIALSLTHCCILTSWSRPPQHRDTRPANNPRMQTHTPPPERHNTTTQPSPTYTHINSRHTNRRAGLFILSMLVQTGRNTFTSLSLTCSNTLFIQWLKVTSHTEDKHQLTALIFIAKAVSTHFHSTRL